MYAAFVEPARRTSWEVPQFEDYRQVGIGVTEAQQWFAASIIPEDVLRFRKMHMTVEEALSWGLRADMVERFKALRFTKTEARKWALAPIWPDHAVIWRHAGYTPAEAAELVAAAADPADALVWMLMVESPEEAIDLKRQGCAPFPILDRVDPD
ncbi:hypothetical protein ABEG17_02730 [Pedococcus sp. KACC 23699]|uniref:Uncharacterized protein n=1 Tax=Pedococcus sp. KACC 23699 TaxID=3149228 RepID=A0AAU7JWK3_9MICO